MSGREPGFLSYLNSDAGLLKPVRGTGVINSLYSRSYNGEIYKDIPARYFPANPVANQYDGVLAYPRKGKGTISLWIKLDGWSMSNTTVSDGQQHYLWNAGGAALASGHSYVIFFPNEGLMFDISDGTNFPRLSITSSAWAADTWYHFACTWDYSLGANEMKIYRDGVLLGEGGTFNDHTYTLDIALGQRLDGSNVGFKGWKAGFRVYDYAKTDFSDRYNLRAGMNDIINIS